MVSLASLAFVLLRLFLVKEKKKKTTHMLHAQAGVDEMLFP